MGGRTARRYRTLDDSVSRGHVERPKGANRLTAKPKLYTTSASVTACAGRSEPVLPRPPRSVHCCLGNETDRRRRRVNASAHSDSRSRTPAPEWLQIV